MRNVLLVCLALLSIVGCTSTDPDVSDANVSNDHPVTGQRIYASVYAVTDNPPLSYEWTTTGGDIEQVVSLPFAAYMTAPEIPGTYTITCTVSDQEKNQTTHTFSIHVRARILEDDLTVVGSEVITLAKQSDTRIGGIWASVRDDNLRFISSTANEESVWSRNFFTMLARTDSYTGIYTIWGVASQGKNISVLTADAEGILACKTCLGTDTIQTLAKDVFDDTILWVGTDMALNYYDQVNNEWGTFLFVKVNDLSEGPDYVYAATNNGVYKLDGKLDPLYSGDSCAVLAVENGTAAEVWSVAGGRIRKNGQNLDIQPASVACSLDRDIAGNIWCGKYWWDGIRWNLVPGLEGVTVVKCVASLEGLIYFLSDSGELYRW